jgi:6-phosphofructokinase 2
MSKIITITFSPCVDKSTSVPSLIPENKLQCTPPELAPGGGGINVARAIKKLGAKATAIFPSGGYTGSFFNYLMQHENVPAVIIKTINETRENIIVLDEATNNQYRFGMPGTELMENEWKACLHAAAEINNVEFIVASGSLPPGTPLNIYAQLARVAKNKKAKLIVDTSGEALSEVLDEGVYLIKPNLTELGMLAGRKKLLPGEVKGFVKEIILKGKCEAVVVSMGADGAMLVTKDITETVTPPTVKRKSTVGAGDSMVAGIVFYLSKGKNLIEAVQYGVACGTAAIINAGTALCNKEDAEKIFKLLQFKAQRKMILKN